jgi:hypothetical protein
MARPLAEHDLSGRNNVCLDSAWLLASVTYPVSIDCLPLFHPWDDEFWMEIPHFPLAVSLYFFRLSHCILILLQIRFLFYNAHVRFALLLLISFQHFTHVTLKCFCQSAATACCYFCKSVVYTHLHMTILHPSVSRTTLCWVLRAFSVS